MESITFTPYALIDGEAFTEKQYRWRIQKVDKDRDRTEFESIFQLAKIKTEKWYSLANPYWPDTREYFDVSTNWFLVKTKYGLIEIGWCKRVIEINWIDTSIRKIVTKDQVTKDDTMVHAYSSLDAIKYLIELVKE